jgi:hypothetical protein
MQEAEGLGNTQPSSVLQLHLTRVLQLTSRCSETKTSRSSNTTLGSERIPMHASERHSYVSLAR